jgi:ankyrin repeat protein
MYQALVAGDVDRVGKLLKTPYVEANDKIRGEPLISIAIRYQHSDVVEVLLKNGADLTAERDNGANVLNSWSLQPLLPMLEFLLPRVKAKFATDKQGFKRFINNPTDPSNGSRTPLCAAMVYSEYPNFTDDEVLQIAKMLVEAGGDVNAVDASGHAPLDYAKCYRTFGQKLDRPETSAYVEQHGAVCAMKSNH